MDFLLHYDYDGSVLYHPPMTAAKAEQILQSVGPVGRWTIVEIEVLGIWHNRSSIGWTEED